MQHPLYIESVKVNMHADTILKATYALLKTSLKPIELKIFRTLKFIVCDTNLFVIATNMIHRLITLVIG